MIKKYKLAIKNNGCNFYGVNTNTFYIKGDKLENQINIKKFGADIYMVGDKVLSGAEIVALTA